MARRGRRRSWRWEHLRGCVWSILLQCYTLPNHAIFHCLVCMTCYLTIVTISRRVIVSCMYWSITQEYHLIDIRRLFKASGTDADAKVRDIRLMANGLATFLHPSHRYEDLCLPAAGLSFYPLHGWNVFDILPFANLKIRYPSHSWTLNLDRPFVKAYFQQHLTRVIDISGRTPWDIRIIRLLLESHCYEYQVCLTFWTVSKASGEEIEAEENSRTPRQWQDDRWTR